MPKKKESKKQPLLVPIDFSPYSEAVLRWAADAAPRYQAPLLILHVVHDLAAAPGYYNSKKGRLRRLEETAGDMMDAYLKQFDEKHPKLRILKIAETALVTGLPVNRILEVAEKTRARQIIIGSQGRTGLPHFLLGSKAERVAQLAPIPVTIVKTGKRPKGEG
ncbi:MAG: universal stress protein [bacterium]|nr:universal stress protein [bacterium]